MYKSAPSEEIGGVGVFIENIARGTAKFGAEHRILVFTRGPVFRIERLSCGAEIYFCPMMFHLASMPVGFGYAVQFVKLLKWADVLHFHHPFPIQDLLYLVAKLFRKMPPALVSYHSDVVRQKLFGSLYAPLGRFFLKSVNQIVTASPNYLESSQVLNNLDNVSVIPYGLSVEELPVLSVQRQKYFESVYGNGYFLFLGALRYYKGLRWLVEAAAVTGLPLIVAGDGEVKEQLQQQAKGYKNIHFTGKVTQEEKVALLSKAKAFVFPSHLRSEAFGVSLLEAQMMRLPLITCEIGTGTSFVNESGVTGLVVSPCNTSALADAMRTLYDSPSLCKKYGNAGYERFLKLFTLEKMVGKYNKIYQELVQQ